MQIQEKISAELRSSVKKARQLAEEQSDLYLTKEEYEAKYGPYEPDYHMDTLTARDHVQDIIPHSRHCDHPFGCYTCFKQFPSGKVHCTEEKWTGWYPMAGCSYWTKIKIKCPACFAQQEREQRKREEECRRSSEREQEQIRAERREENYRQKQKRAIRAEIEVRRLGKMSRSKPMNEFNQTLSKLKIPVLKKLCKRNGLMNSGKKAQLVFRLTAARFHGTLYVCPYCKKKKLELQYEHDDDMEPQGIRCKHMKGQGRQCTFKKYFNDDDETKVTVLKNVFRDTEQLDLNSVMMTKNLIRKSKK